MAVSPKRSFSCSADNKISGLALEKDEAAHRIA